MNDSGVTEAVFELECHFNRVIGVVGTDERDERHHLLFGNERVGRVRFAVEDLCVRRNGQADRCRKNRWVFADQVAVQHPVSARFGRWREGCF